MNTRGFTLVEALTAIAVFALFVLGIYGGIQLVFKVVFNSRVRIIETALLNEQIESIRNIPFHSVGIINGSPSGVLVRTVTTTRNGIDFTITRTIRNVDDPFDGTIGGNPNDTSPADYKLVQVDVLCTTCAQRNPVRMTTQVAPKYLEGDPNNGALFIDVFDAAAAPVQGATVHVVATSTSSTIDLTDTTDNNGRLTLVDLPQGVSAYDITVSKTGFTTDATLRPSQSVPNPVKPPASVIAQNVTSISFSIDQASIFSLYTKDVLCQAVGSVPVAIAGTKLLGTNPDVLKYSQNITMEVSGEAGVQNLEWDTYSLTPSNYDLIGSIPAVPVTLPPGVNQSVTMVLGPNTTRSLLVQAQDSITGQPLSNATVTVTTTAYNNSGTTGVGFLRQTDWSGGGGQASYTDQTQYWTDDGGLETGNPAGDLKLRLVGAQYVAAGELESSTFDFGNGVNYINLVWEPLAQPAETGTTSLRFQVATSNSSTPATWVYRGPDGTTSTYYSATSPVIHSVHDTERYFRYKTFLSTDAATSTPILSDLVVTYTNSCSPPGQVYFGGLANDTYGVQVTRTGYVTTTDSIAVSGDETLVINMVPL